MGNDLANPPEVPPIHRARMPVTVALLHQLLRLPDETRIVAGTLSPDGRILEFVIEDPRLEPIYEGQEIPTNIPNYVSYGHRTGTLIQVIWAFGSEEIRTGDIIPDDDPPHDDPPHEHEWSSPELTGPRRCVACGYPLTPALEDEIE